MAWSLAEATANLVSNWAYMVMTSLAWSFKAWLALAYPVMPRSEDADRAMKRRLMTMEYRTFFHALVWTSMPDRQNSTTNNRASTRHINSMAACLQKIGESMFLLSEDTSKVG